MSTWNKKNFSIYTSDERSALGLIEELGKQTNYNTEEVEKVKESDSKKVSHDEMHNTYKIDNDANFTGSWFGIKRPTASSEGLQATVNKIVDVDIPELNLNVEKLEMYKASKEDVARISSGTPLFASSTTQMTDTTKNYVNTTDGYLYIYSGGSWVNTNVKYQEKGITKGQITIPKTNFFNNSKNLFNKNSVYNKIGQYIGSTGGIVENKSYYTSHKIDVEKGEKYTIRYAEMLFGAFYNESGNYISKIGTGSGTQSPFTFTVPEGAKYMVVCGRVSDIDNDMVVSGTTYPSVYEEFYLNLNENVMLNNTQKEEVISTTKENFFDKTMSDNLINLENVTEGMFLSGTGEVINSSYFTTDFIEVKDGDIVRYYYDEAMGSNNKLYMYDENKELISNVGGAIYGDYKEVTFNIERIKYVRVSHYNRNKNIAMLTVNKPYPSSFDPYVNKSYLNENYSLNNKQMKEVKEIANTNPLYGEVISCNGDSIMAGAGSTGGFAKIIAERNNMIYENIAVGGGTITSGTTYSTNGSNRHWICKTIGNMRSDAKYVLLEGGVNDSSLGIPMGVITEDFTSTLDETTFCGAFESMLKQAIERFPGKKIGYVFVHKMSKGFDSRYDNNYYTNAKKILEKWGIPYKDLNVECPPLNYIPYLKATYTKDGDGWHPNTEGYNLFYVEQIESWLKTI